MSVACCPKLPIVLLLGILCNSPHTSGDLSVLNSQPASLDSRCDTSPCSDPSANMSSWTLSLVTSWRQKGHISDYSLITSAALEEQFCSVYPALIYVSHQSNYLLQQSWSTRVQQWEAHFSLYSKNGWMSSVCNKAGQIKRELRYSHLNKDWHEIWTCCRKHLDMAESADQIKTLERIDRQTL